MLFPTCSVGAPNIYLQTVPLLYSWLSLAHACTATAYGLLRMGEHPVFRVSLRLGQFTSYNYCYNYMIISISTTDDPCIASSQSRVDHKILIEELDKAGI